MEIDVIDVKGNLESIRNLADIGMMMIDLNKLQYVPTLLEDIMEHAQRLVIEYASVE